MGNFALAVLTTIALGAGWTWLLARWWMARPPRGVAEVDRWLESWRRIGGGS